MDHRMSVYQALLHYLVLIVHPACAFIAGVDGPLLYQEALEGGNTTLYCDTVPTVADDELMLLVWYKGDDSIYSYDARISSDWSSVTFNRTGRLTVDLHKNPTVLSVSALREDDQALYHCRVEFLLSPTRYTGVNLTVIVPPSKPFFLDELGNKVQNKVGPYFEGDTLVLNCLVIGGRPPPLITWYSGGILVDASDSESDIPNVRQNELYLPLMRDNAENLSCEATNTHLSPPVSAYVDIELYLSADNVSIHWIQGIQNGSLQSGQTAVVQCTAYGVYPSPEVAWWLNHKHLTQYSNKTWNNVTRTAVSRLQFVPTKADNQATLACVCTNPAIPPGRNSKADVVTLNVTYAPIVEISTLNMSKLDEVIENKVLQLMCEVEANPPADKIRWYFNGEQIKEGGIWGDDVFSNTIFIQEAKRAHTGLYTCLARNNIGENKAELVNITVLYSPECRGLGVTLRDETLVCNVTALPVPNTYIWQTQIGSQIYNFTTDLPFIPLSQFKVPLTTTVNVTCKADNSVASQQKPCTRSISFKHLRPEPPQQCDLAYEEEQFQIKCIPVDNATYYEVTVWRMSKTNASLILDYRNSMGFGTSQALTRHGGNIWLVRGKLGTLNHGDEAGAAACNRYGCSASLLLRPTEKLISSASVPWWKSVLDKDVGISLGIALLVIVFVISTALVVSVARRSLKKQPAPVIQVVQIDDVTRDYLSSTRELKAHPSCSLRSCSSNFLDGNEEKTLTNWRREHVLRDWDPPPDVTLIRHRESAV
ncbi:unnamed protein product [Parnassius apollo]|uniref:(apollo) hypothetical protein n=1 Tax=Parnassius apollo TaxID=110799 RepID=A0A8S3VYJ1_PARAO|nr:unnamed protein product [Parnassius apollo]